ncbi:hypothetical protein M514_06662 [Trichuris suis]|uniref:Uncharacterized protein n=1 Tax=Trichuris suis TaxID=68888 RepID=A0A085M5G9_9BILA|nr:hypothetical protein M513_06662 [Trichuris suis]KFD69001.1 hypothetical protein M514_06662 [Trichuris suis]
MPYSGERLKMRRGPSALCWMRNVCWDASLGIEHSLNLTLLMGANFVCIMWDKQTPVTPQVKIQIQKSNSEGLEDHLKVYGTHKDREITSLISDETSTIDKYVSPHDTKGNSLLTSFIPYAKLRVVVALSK